MQKVISDEVRQIVSEPAAGIRYEAIFQRLEPSDGKYVGDAEVRLMRAYHACVFERLKFLFLSLQESPGVPQEMLDIVYTELSIHFRLANEFTEVCRYRTRMTKLDMPRQYSTGGNDNSHTIGHVEPCLLHPDYAEKYEQASRIIGRRLDEFIKGIISCIKYLQNARAESEDNRIVRQDASRDRERFPIYESTDDWGSLWTYEELNKLPLSNRPWLPLRAAHERLIIERVRFDIEHLYLLPDSAEATRRLRPFSKFLQDHQRKLEELEKLLLSDGTLDRGVSIEHQRPEIPVFGNSLDAVKNLTPATVRPHQHPVEASPPPKVPYMGVYTPWDETYVLGREARDDAETSSSKPPKGPQDGDTLSTIIAFPDTLDEPVQTIPNRPVLLDLLGTDSCREENTGLPPPEMINFRDAAEERALCLSLGRSERLEEQPTPARSSAVRDRSDTYNDRARGKRPMDAHESTNVASLSFDAWLAPRTYGSTHEGSSQGSRKLRNSGEGRGERRDQL
ncbi:hypothetical protein SeMB42_g01780 [Synchytrium endobioticum]|uniref:Uncharacterized protein n=1 Tax=Synchytrium endobioticum TaxID=286115 RepID=A0A507DKZ7_9FUNG|nr:hypothetical protein SeMB42_g01780 [Synchytrium endobioticum]